MDVRTGEILTPDRVAMLGPNVSRACAAGRDRPFARPMRLAPTPAQLARRRVGRNDPCPCGSGRKFKRCCLVRGPAPRAGRALAEIEARNRGPSR